MLLPNVFGRKETQSRLCHFGEASFQLLWSNEANSFSIKFHLIMKVNNYDKMQAPYLA
jgi:hypothetical protein